MKSAAVVSATAALLPAPARARPRLVLPPSAGRVVRATAQRVIDSAEAIDTAVLGPMIEETLVALTGADNVQDAWNDILPELQTTDVIGFKINMINSRSLVSHRELVYGLAESLINSVGLNPNNIIIWDRSDTELTRGGYELNRSDTGIQCFGTLPRRMSVLGMKGDSPGYDDELEVEVGNGKTVHFSRILTRMCDHIVNVPVLKDHRITGVTLSMKNLYGVIDRPMACHGNGGDPYLGNLSANEVVRNKTKLLFADALFGCYSGGPGGPPQFINRQLMASRDPVAIDSVALDMIDLRRQEQDLEPAANRAGYLKTAAQMGVGIEDRELIELIEA